MNAGRLIQCVGWLAFLILLATGGRHNAYIVSWQHGIIIAAAIGFALLLACDLAFNRGAAHAHDGHDHHDHDHGGAPDRWLQSAVHLLPLFFVIAVGSSGLGAQAITIVRATVPGAGAQAQPAPVKPPPAVPGVPPTTAAPPDLADAPSTPEPAPPAAPAAPGVAVPLTLTELYFPAKHPGVTTVETLGRILVPTEEDLKKVPADVDTSEMKLMLYRFHMTCCAADARPVFIILLGHDPKGLENEAWAKVTGRWVPAPGLGDMAKLVVEKLEIVPPPKEPYISDTPGAPQP